MISSVVSASTGMMSLLVLPAELRLRIYDYLPEFQVDRIENITATSKLTPSICRVNRLLRREALRLFATNTNFTISMDNGAPFWLQRVACWTKTLGADLLPRIRSLQLSRHWDLPLPFQYQGHVGFYVKIDLRNAPSGLHGQGWVPNFEPTTRLAIWAERTGIPIHSDGCGVTIGTYPVSKDCRKARLDSVQLLANAIRGRALARTSEGTRQGVELDCGYVNFVVRAMDIVATHPILALHGETEACNEICKTWSVLNDEFNKLSCEMTA